MARRKKLADPDKPVEIKKTKTGKITKKTTKKKFDTKFIDIAQRLVGQGFTEKDVALTLGVAPGTIQTWKHRNEDFRKACEEGMKVRVAQLAAKGQMAAIGYDYEETCETFKPKLNEDTGKKELELVEKKVYKKHKTPDAKLIEFFLINYAPMLYKSINKIEYDQSKNLTINDSSGQVTEQLTKLAGAFLESRKHVDSKVIDEVRQPGEVSEDDSENIDGQYTISDGVTSEATS